MSVRPRSQEAIWHDVECGAYAADLPLWEELARAGAGPALELGAGTGRVALHLAAAGHPIVALDRSQALLEVLSARAVERGLEVETVHGDAASLELGRAFATIVAPMQLLHVVGGPARRAALLAGARGHLEHGGTFAAALLGDGAVVPAAEAGPPPLPDVRELDGSIYSSLPIEVVAVGGGLEVRRLRQVVSPEGELSERTDAIRLDELTADQLEAAAGAAGLSPVERVEVAATDDHVGSVVCVMEAV